MNVLDTNVWLYGQDRRDPVKQQAAVDLIEATTSLCLPWQVGCEFIAGSRKFASFGFTEEQAWNALRSMESMAERVIFPNRALWRIAPELQSRHMLSFWDALLVASCIDSQVKKLFTEDMGAPRTIDGLELVNPFAGLTAT